MKKIIYLIPLLLLFPLGADAVFNTFNTAGGGQITLPSNGLTYTIQPSTRLESFTVKTSQMDFEMSAGSLLELKSADRSNFVVASSPCEVRTTCENSQSILLIHCTTNITAQTITVTIDGTCTGSTGTSGGSSGGAAAGGGGEKKAIAPPPAPPPPPPPPPASVSKQIALAPSPAPAPAVALVAQKIATQLNTASKGAEVKKLEEKLQALGYLSKTAKADGVYDKDVVEAVKKFQKANKLSQVGVVGPATLAALNKITQAPAALAPAPTPAPAPASAPAFTKQLSVGSKGEDVKKLEQTLIDLGYLPKTAKVDGTFDKEASDAVKKLQKANGLSQVGAVGPATLKLLNSGSVKSAIPAPAPTPAPTPSASAQSFTKNLAIGSSGDEVKLLQERLQDLGFFPASIDPNGYFGPTTAASLKKFQSANGVAPVGYVGPNTRKVLNK